MHSFRIAEPGYWPTGAVGAVRLWDAGTTWADLEPAPGVFLWERLDAAVANAEANGGTVRLVLGMTPGWASRRPSEPAHAGPGTAAPPRRVGMWRRYVQAVADRYAGRIDSYEIWNEADLPGFWTGTVGQLAELTRIAAAAVGDRAELLSPSTLPLRGNGVRWMLRFAAAGGYRPVDGVAVHGYTASTGTPEQAVAGLRRVRQRLADAGVHRPLHNTEMNFGMWLPEPLPRLTQAQYVSRNTLLSWAAGISDVSWYAWEATHRSGAGILLTRDGWPTGAGRVFAVTREWMRGDVQSCSVDRRRTWRCVIDKTDHRLVVRGVEEGDEVAVRLPRRTVSAQGMYGLNRDLRPDGRVRLTGSPVAFTVRRG
jgi:hypothetical protein